MRGAIVGSLHGGLDAMYEARDAVVGHGLALLHELLLGLRGAVGLAGATCCVDALGGSRGGITGGKL